MTCTCNSRKVMGDKDAKMVRVQFVESDSKFCHQTERYIGDDVDNENVLVVGVEVERNSDYFR